MKKAPKELILFGVIFILVAFVIHMDRWLTAPIEHFKNLTNHGLPWHPLLYALIVYIIILGLRGLFALLLGRRKN